MGFDTRQAGRMPGWNDPATGAAAVTPSDTVADTNGPFRKLYVGAPGAVKVTMLDGGDVTFPNVAAGTILDLAVTKVFSTGTTVAAPGTNIIGLK